MKFLPGQLLRNNHWDYILLCTKDFVDYFEEGREVEYYYNLFVNLIRYPTYGDKANWELAKKHMLALEPGSCVLVIDEWHGWVENHRFSFIKILFNQKLWYCPTSRWYHIVENSYFRLIS